MIKLKRYVYEFANDTIKERKEIARNFPEKAEEMESQIARIERAVKGAEHGFITGRECMGIIVKIVS